jgi:hypothetical protein
MVKRLAVKNKTPRTARRQQKALTPRPRMLADLERSGLSAQDAKQLGYVPCTAEQSTKLNLSRTSEGYILPAHDVDGNETDNFQFRYFVTEVDSGFTRGAKLRKYCQPRGTDPAIDMPPIGDKDWLQIRENPNQAVVVTEGFKKAACVTKLTEFPSIGVTGVWNFRQKRKGHDIIPALRDAFDWNGRRTYICYDSDAAMNLQVVMAENSLARELTKLGAMPSIVRIPQDGASKVGADDFILKHGADAFKLLLTGRDTKPYELASHLHEMSEEFGVVQSVAAVIEYPNRNHAECRFHLHDRFIKVVAADKTMKITRLRATSIRTQTTIRRPSRWRRNSLSGPERRATITSSLRRAGTE